MSENDKLIRQKLAPELDGRRVEDVIRELWVRVQKLEQQIAILRSTCG